MTPGEKLAKAWVGDSWKPIAIRGLGAEIDAAIAAERQRWLDCAQVDATMDGPVRYGWNHSALGRLYDAATKETP